MVPPLPVGNRFGIWINPPKQELIGYVATETAGLTNVTYGVVSVPALRTRPLRSSWSPTCCPLVRAGSVALYTPPTSSDRAAAAPGDTGPFAASAVLIAPPGDTEALFVPPLSTSWTPPITADPADSTHAPLCVTAPITSVPAASVAVRVPVSN